MYIFITYTCKYRMKFCCFTLSPFTTFAYRTDYIKKCIQKGNINTTLLRLRSTFQDKENSNCSVTSLATNKNHRKSEYDRNVTERSNATKARVFYDTTRDEVSEDVVDLKLVSRSRQNRGLRQHPARLLLTVAELHHVGVIGPRDDRQDEDHW